MLDKNSLFFGLFPHLAPGLCAYFSFGDVPWQADRPHDRGYHSTIFLVNEARFPWPRPRKKLPCRDD